MKLKHYRLTAWMEGRPDLPLYMCDVQALDEEDARQQAHLPNWGPCLRVTVPVTWDVAEAPGRASGSVLAPTDELAHIKDQRDRALALLRDPRAGTGCGYEDPAKCPGDWSGEGETKIADVCWEHRCRALQSEVERAQ